MFVNTRRFFVALSTLLPLFGAGLAQAGITWNQCEAGYDRASFEQDNVCAYMCYSQDCDRVSPSCYDTCLAEDWATPAPAVPGKTSQSTSSQTSGPQTDCECLIAGGRWNYDSRTCMFGASGYGGGSSGGDIYAQERNDFGQATNTQLGLGTGQNNTSFYGVKLAYY